MDLADVLQLLHVISGFVLVAGILGRDVLLSRARRSDDSSSIQELVDAAGPFERFMVIPGSFAVLLLGDPYLVGPAITSVAVGVPLGHRVPDRVSHDHPACPTGLCPEGAEV